MNIAFVTTRLFDAPRSGGELCTARLQQALLRAGHRLHVIGRGNAPPAAVRGLRHSTLGPLVAAMADRPARAQLASALAALASGQALTVQRLAEGGVPARLRALLLAPGQPRPDALWVDHLQAWPWVADLADALGPPVLVMHNLEAAGYAELAEASGRGAAHWLRRQAYRREARLLARWENSALRQAGAVACLSDGDARQLRAQAAAGGATPVVQVLPGYPLRSRSPAPRRPPGAPCRIGLIGTWTWAPNRASLHWLLTQVLPLLPQTCRLVLAGAGLEGLALPARVQALGRVADAADFYAQVDVVAVPSLQGSGVQEKAIEAIASGRPVVATAHALRGLGSGLPPAVRTADTPAAFAAACHAAAQDDPAHGAQAAQAWADARRLQYDTALARCLQAGAGGARPGAATGAWPMGA